MTNAIQLVDIMQDQALTTSLKVAEYFGKRHDRVLRAITALIQALPKNAGSEKAFIKSTYTDETGKKNPMYYLNRDAFTFVAMGFTGKKAAEFKWTYIQAFNTMEAILKERKSLNWQQMRKKQITTRNSETDVIKQLAEYAKAQGSEHSEMLYITYSNLANKAVGIKSKMRDKVPTHILCRLEYFEDIILKQIRKSMDENKHYKQIYQDCKQRLQMLLEISLSNLKLT